MRSSSIFIAFTVATGAIAASVQTVPDPLATIGDPSEVLSVSYAVGSTKVNVTPGVNLNSSVTHNAPTVHLNETSLSGSGPYLFMMVDPDINKTNPMYVGMHTMAINLTTSGKTSDEDAICTYFYPEPTEGPAHNYTFLLFKQPQNFTVPRQYSPFLATTSNTPYNRINFPLMEFVKEAGLGEPVAANYFQEAAESNSTATSSSSTTATTATSTATETAATSTHTGAANKLGYSGSYLIGMSVAVGALMVAV
ncbi:mitochondrial 54S ribosomal protein mL38 [Aspergillus homomorphus CBS 101889]|uniref:PEBP-like protein n=1 Tax=Aspergillus homomorphus (strain CBS 101889) TaxID=1450537 RepID=A0A395HXG1_ASPHC|nr:PEBP-like protein [Aspergillus homomorphus CBS 101889]RAL12612.1 PEBP-like protein [Aspergillus homomorphus CBS 101889]